MRGQELANQRELHPEIGDQLRGLDSGVNVSLSLGLLVPEKVARVGGLVGLTVLVAAGGARIVADHISHLLEVRTREVVAQSFEAGRQQENEEMQPELEEREAELDEVRAELLEAQQRAAEYAPATDAERRDYVDALRRWVRDNSRKPVTEELLEENLGGPLRELLEVTFKHIGHVNWMMDFELWTREEVLALAKGGECGPTRIDLLSRNGWTNSASLEEAKINLVDDFSVRRGNDGDVYLVESRSVGDYWYVAAHEMIHGLRINTYNYYVKSGDGYIDFDGLDIRDDTTGDECGPIRVLGNVDEVAVDWLVGEVYMMDEENLAEELSQWRHPLMVERMKALAFLVTEAVGMTRMDFAELYFTSDAKFVETEFDRLINERLERGEFEVAAGEERIQVVVDALNHIELGEIDEFYRLMEEELGLERPVEDEVRPERRDVREKVVRGRNGREPELGGSKRKARVKLERVAADRVAADGERLTMLEPMLGGGQEPVSVQVEDEVVLWQANDSGIPAAARRHRSQVRELGRRTRQQGNGFNPRGNFGWGRR